jgi:hypothetical protein
MGFLQRFLTGDVLEEHELTAAAAEGIELHVRKAKVSVAYDNYRAPGKRFNGKRHLSSGGVLVTRQRIVLWAAGQRWLDLARETLPSPALDVSTDDGVLQVAFAAESFHPDRSGQVRVRLWTSEAQRVATLLAA